MSTSESAPSSTSEGAPGLVAAARRPTAEWLESCFGAGALWRPDEADLPAGLKHEGTRAFLTGTGLPAARITWLDFDATKLPERGMWEADPDDLFALRAPDDFSPPTRHAYCVGTVGLLHLMVDGESGEVEIFNPETYDTGDGYGGTAAESLPELLGALALAAHFDARLDYDDPAAALTALDELTALLDELGQDPDGSDFWEPLLESQRENFEAELYEDED